MHKRGCSSNAAWHRSAGIRLLILVGFKIHGNINVSLDANLGARSSLFITNTTANGTVMLTLAGIQAFTQVWMFLVRMLYS